MARLVDEPQQPFVGDQDTADAESDRTFDIAERVHELVQPRLPPAHDFPIGRERLTCAFPGDAGPDEEGSFDAVRPAELGHRRDLGVREQHDAAALRGAMERDVEAFRVDHRVEGC